MQTTQQTKEGMLNKIQMSVDHINNTYQMELGCEIAYQFDGFNRISFHYGKEEKETLTEFLSFPEARVFLQGFASGAKIMERSKYIRGGINI